MIPRSVNKRTNPTIVDDWDIVSETQETRAIAKETETAKEKIKDLNSEYNSDSDSDSETNGDLEKEQQYLIEKINKLCRSEPKILDEETNDFKYIYKGPDSLNQDLVGYFLDVNEKNAEPTVHICAYHINNNHKQPFLEYFLFKPIKKDEELFILPSFKYESAMNVVTKSITVMQALCITYYKRLEYNYKGFLGDCNNLYLFFDCSNLKLDSYVMSRHNDLWLATIDEIVNQERLCNFKIDKKVVDFFKANPSFLFLTDLAGRAIETPTVVYSGCSWKKISFIATFGIPCEEEEALMGKYYYFTNYQNATKKSECLNNEEERGGLIRCALFLGKMKVPLNRQSDIIDESSITKDMLLKNDENSGIHKKIKMMLRVSDRDGGWTSDYDSVFLGHLELDDGSVFNDNPLWVIKDWEQQVVLSSHIIEKTESIDSEHFIL